MMCQWKIKINKKKKKDISHETLDAARVSA